MEHSGASRYMPYSGKVASWGENVLMRRFDLAWLIFWGLASSVWCLTAAHQLSATFDEPFYLRAGVESWRTGSNRELMKAGTMPLPVDVECLPISLWERRRGNTFDLDHDLHALLPFARGMNLLFWWLLLTYGMLLARRFGGATGGRLAVVMLATEPNLLGHACLATTDIAVAAMVVVFGYHFVRGREGGRWQRWLLPGLLYGLAMSAKASALLFVPIVAVALESPRWFAAGGLRQAWHASQHIVQIRGRFSRSESLSYLSIAALIGSRSPDSNGWQQQCLIPGPGRRRFAG